MAYIDDQRRQVIQIRDKLFRDPGYGIFYNKEREFVLQDPRLNLWAGIREDAVDYFHRNDIPWWMGGEENEPTGHLLSSQIACVNHLYFLRQRKDVADTVLNNVSADFVGAERVDDGFVEFEVIGEENYLGERSHTRGANATSLDAVMVARKKSGAKTLIIIEWKYTESYPIGESKYIPARAKIYDPLLSEPDCPIKVDNPEVLYYEPFYQLMRQTLLGWLMVKNGEYGCSEYLHLHAIPAKNKDLRDRVTSPNLKGNSLSDAWKNVLRIPTVYRVIDPVELIRPAQKLPDTASFMNYLLQRYWN